MYDDKNLGVAARLVCVSVTASLLAGCYVPPPRERIVRTETVIEAPVGIVAVRPPEPRSELIPPPPNERVVWDPGRWRWDGHGYVWLAGHYVERPFARAVWEPGHWIVRNGGWVWEDGHWRT